MNSDRNRLFIPALAPLYDFLGTLAYPFIRVVAGLMMVPFGWMKLTGPMFDVDVELFRQMGLEPAVALAWFIASLEFFGGWLLAFGLFTRPIALMLAVEMAVITLAVAIPKGSGYQLTILWGSVLLAISWRGAGRYSLDRLIGKEL